MGVDITEEREALVRAREQERIVSLGNLVSGLTHELRNPINGALLQLTVVARALARPRDEWIERVAAEVAQAAGEIRRVSGILDDFLVFTRPQLIHLERTDVRSSAARAVERSAPRAQAAWVTVSLDISADAIAETDRSRVETAVYQLIANAIDAAVDAEDRVVWVRVVGAGNMVAIRSRTTEQACWPLSDRCSSRSSRPRRAALAWALDRSASRNRSRRSIEHELRDGATVFRMRIPVVGGVAN